MTNYLMLYSYGNKSEPDLLLTLFTLLSFFFYIKSPKNFKFIIVSSIFMGLGILTKGVSPLFFYPGIVVYLLLHKRNQFYSYIKFLLLHLLLSLILPTCWIILYYYNGNINDLITVFSSEATSRAKGEIGRIVTHFLVFPLRIFLALFPWSILLFFYKKFSFKTKNDLFNSALIIFIVSFLIMAILPGGRGRYFMPAVPFFAISISHLLNDDFNHNISWNKYISYLLATIFVISAGFLIYNKAYLQILIIFIGFLLFIFLVKNTKSVIYLLLFVNLLGFTIFTNTYEYYRATNYYNYKKAAKKVITSLNEDLPLVVDTSINPIQLLFNYERMSKKLVYSSAVNTFKKYYFVTNKNLKECEKVLELKYSKKRLKKIFFYKSQK
ncbi:hypothetical protein DEFDS_1182 [Deferribacter desulfuricans SSM1]|uniref:Glycosyltransferase RgtA/B/C/D-like domain-containing protein n=1 Tax=Deferribacter desulfuricans (strain DSM 14783 / JCM 11476 / NBRC 101012 / SSM1) TaxID=639282 RepID=D3PDH8_DEFDS|nr:glycosyltransferase family 39 protein [Deferribacter desulfuricans]BAI80651.1 hypothetical protein DEFDS_1182 [Deferribacter desulfuricans SSM1]